jgi:hypothetical protein
MALFVRSFTEMNLGPNGRSVLIGLDHGNGRYAVVEPFIMRAFDDSPINPEPTIRGQEGNEFLQAALEHAWEIGLRPKNWRVETTEQVAAMTNHLQDMRALVFGKPPEIPLMPMSQVKF